MNFVRTTAGRYATEKDDCTVRALKVVTGVPYREAHEKLRWWGRQNGQPFNVTAVLRRRVLGKRFKRVRTFYNRLPYWISEFNHGFSARAITLAEFIAKHPKGTFYICTRDHAVALVNGAIHDLRKGLISADSELDSAWQVS